MIFSSIFSYFVPTIACYLIGSVPFGILIAKLFKLKDLRAVGSGNIGATNAFRAGGYLAGGLTFLFDASKGALAVFIFKDYAEWALFVVVLGHIAPIWLIFKGGKGVATFLGAVLALDYRIGVFALLAWSGVFALTRISSIASITSTVATTALLYFFADVICILPLIATACVIIFRHMENIKRLLANKEPSTNKESSP